MEQINDLINKRPETLSPTDHIAKVIPVDKQRAMGDVFDRWRLNCGWNPWDNDTQMAAIASFVHTLDREGVPASAYSELYERVLQMRAKALQDGKQIPNFGVDLMVSQWTGDWGLRAQLRQREVEAGRTLTANAESICQRCFGSDWEVIEGKGARRCDHL